MKPAFLYALHSGNLYGTERMALVTLEGLADRFEPVLFAPPGPALAEARRLGIATEEFRGPAEFGRRLLPHIRRNQRIAFAATGVMHSLVFLTLNLPFRRRNLHLHLVHGGTDEADSYGRKPLLNYWNITLVAVSEYVRERLIANGACPDKIVVAENFLPGRQIATAPRRPPFRHSAVKRVVIVSRVDPIKRIDLLLDALDRHPALERLSFRVLGTGWDLDQLRARAAERHRNVAFEGFCPNVPDALAASDLLLHLCPVEPFGLAILEAMAAGLPVLVPDRGGAGGLVVPNVSGFRFRSDDPDDLAAALLNLAASPAKRLNAAVSAADARLRDLYSDRAGLDRYLHLLEPLCHD